MNSTTTLQETGKFRGARFIIFTFYYIVVSVLAGVIISETLKQGVVFREVRMWTHAALTLLWALFISRLLLATTEVNTAIKIIVYAVSLILFTGSLFVVVMVLTGLYWSSA